MHQQQPQTPLFASTSAAKSSQVAGVSRRVVYWVTADVTGVLSCLRDSVLVAFDIDDLSQRVPDLYQIRGVGHDNVDVLVRGRDLVEERVGPAPFDPGHGVVELGAGERLARGRAGVFAAGAVGAAVEGEPAALADHHIGPSAH